MLDEIPSGTKEEVIDKQKARDWFKVRKYAVNRMREGASQASVALWAGVSLGFANKWWNVWKRTKSWDALHTRSSAPKRVRAKRYWCVDEIVDLKRRHPELGAQKIRAMLGIDLSHQKVYEVLVEEGLITPGPKARRVWKAFSRKHSNSVWQMDILELDDRKERPLVTIIRCACWPAGSWPAPPLRR